MRRTSYEQMNCSIASALEVVGEPWTLLIVRDAFYGVNSRKTSASPATC